LAAQKAVPLKTPAVEEGKAYPIPKPNLSVLKEATAALSQPKKPTTNSNALTAGNTSSSSPATGKASPAKANPQPANKVFDTIPAFLSRHKPGTKKRLAKFSPKLIGRRGAKAKVIGQSGQKAKAAPAKIHNPPPLLSKYPIISHPASNNRIASHPTNTNPTVHNPSF
jgi:hypothetical protein